MKESGAADGEAGGVEMLRGPSAPDAGTGLYEPPRSPSPLPGAQRPPSSSRREAKAPSGHAGVAESGCNSDPCLRGPAPSPELGSSAVHLESHLASATGAA